ncbi:dTDP-4-dehydrorhamnose 3,5-epimerase family protein [Reyranella sp. CPCC 100927]|uniref:dTDP-4-dehydrorhamnose 3,5-epimerase family protein n=1 Tax=Reyranella sp. CPCC 100927 TaxID=2599616 RepID=UPI0021020461|nr:dTDP-4-dehydrorhamnose 3,5-epimerase family protein [Reyranella sp. CPCC 100927]
MVTDNFLPAGVHIQTLKTHPDERGSFTEIFRETWDVGCHAVQWNAVHSRAGVLRGVHVHVTHDDYLVALSGVLVLGLHDMRRHSRSVGWSRIMTLDAAAPLAITIPPGVCHGFYFPVPSLHVYAVSAYWNPQDELGCRFDSAELDLAWPDRDPRLSERDQHAGTYQQMCDAFQSRHEMLAPAGAQ